MRRIHIFLWNGFLLTATSLLMRIVVFSFNVYISKKIGAEALGVFQLILSVYLFTITLATSGINLAVTRIVVEQTTLYPNYGTRKAIHKCLLYSASFGILASVLLLLFAKPIAFYLLHDKVPFYLFDIIAISLPCIAMSSALNGYFTALRKNGKNAINRIFEQFIKISATSYFLSIFMPSGLEYACLSLVLGEALSEIMSFFFALFLYHFEKGKHGPELNHANDYLKQILKISLPVAMTSYIRSGLASLKQLLIPLRLEKSGIDCHAAVTQYGTITGMTMPVLMFPEVIINSFSGLLVPEFTYYYTKKDFTRIRCIISKIFGITFLFSIGIIGCFLFYAKDINQLIYQNLEIVSYLKILCPLILLMYLDSIVDNMLKGLDKQIGVMKCNILDLFVSILCIYFLLPIFGMNGYLFVIFLSEFLNTGISLFQLKQLTRFTINIKNWILKPLISIILSYIICSVLVPQRGNFTLAIVLQLVLFIGVYFILLVITNAFDGVIEKRR